MQQLGRTGLGLMKVAVPLTAWVGFSVRPRCTLLRGSTHMNRTYHMCVSGQQLAFGIIVIIDPKKKKISMAEGMQREQGT